MAAKKTTPAKGKASTKPKTRHEASRKSSRPRRALGLDAIIGAMKNNTSFADTIKKLLEDSYSPNVATATTAQKRLESYYYPTDDDLKNLCGIPRSNQGAYRVCTVPTYNLLIAREAVLYAHRCR